jgi:protein TonB
MPTKGDARLLFPVLPPPQVPTNSLTIESLHDCAPTRADYPAQSRKYNKEGTTRVSFEVDNTGKVTAFGVTKSSGFLRLDFAALVKLATCKFKPATAPDGAPIGGSFKVEYIWRLE